jgi:hypothetical protein
VKILGVKGGPSPNSNRFDQVCVWPNTFSSSPTDAFAFKHNPNGGNTITNSAVRMAEATWAVSYVKATKSSTGNSITDLCIYPPTLGAKISATSSFTTLTTQAVTIPDDCH